MERALGRRDPWDGLMAMPSGQGRAGSLHAEKVITEEGPLISHEVFGTVVAPSVCGCVLVITFLSIHGASGDSQDTTEGWTPPESGRGGRTGHTEQEAAHRGQDSSRTAEAPEGKGSRGCTCLARPLHPLCQAPCC